MICWTGLVIELGRTTQPVINTDGNMPTNKILLLAIILLSKNIIAQETITINAGVNDGAFKNYIGFLHGETNLETSPTALTLVKKLKPRFWRNSDWFQTQKLACSLSINTTLVISDFYANYKGGYSNAKPWHNWAEYETFVTTLVKKYNNEGLAPTYWDVWNEPNDALYWSGNLSQLIECFKRTRLIINTIDPSIKIVGPSINSYNGAGLEYILDSLASSGIRLNAVSWHEFGLPDSLSNHTTDFRNRSLLNPLWANPEIHINEYSPQQTNQIPAYRLAWLYHLEQNNVNWANTACWNNFDGITNWSNCNIGLNGLFWHDEQSPLPAYWVNRAYAEMQTGERIFCDRSDAKTLALSSKTDSLKEMMVLVGRYYSIDNGTFLPNDIGKDSSDVLITINNYPYLTNGTIPLLIQKIPKGNINYQNLPLSFPITVFVGKADVMESIINLTVSNFLDGDVYCLYLNSSNVLGINETREQNDFNIFPNPGSTNITIETTEDVNNKLQITNSMGILVKEETLNGNRVTINIADIPSGLYFIQVGNKTKKVIIK